MDCTQARIGQGHAAEKAREGHRLPCRRVTPIPVGCYEGTSDRGYAFAAKRVDEGIGLVADEGLDELSEGIHAGVGSGSRRQSIAQFRIDDGEARDHSRGTETHLNLVLDRTQDGVLRHLGTGPCGSGQGDAG